MSCIVKPTIETFVSAQDLAVMRPSVQNVVEKLMQGEAYGYWVKLWESLVGKWLKGELEDESAETIEDEDSEFDQEYVAFEQTAIDALGAYSELKTKTDRASESCLRLLSLSGLDNKTIMNNLIVLEYANTASERSWTGAPKSSVTLATATM